MFFRKKNKYKFRHLVTSFLLGSLLFSSVTLAMVNPNKERGESTGVIQVSIVNQKGESIGSAQLSEVNNGVRLQIAVTNLPPGAHGFHIHEKQFEGTDFNSAGAHFNPTGKQHGFMNPKGYHLGDMMNLMVTNEGRASMEYFFENANLQPNHEYSLLGKSIIIHEKEDDYITDPSGNSGERIAGGNITVSR